MFSILTKVCKTGVLLGLIITTNLFVSNKVNAFNNASLTQEQQTLPNILVFEGHTRAPFNLYINNGQGEQLVSAKHTQLGNGNVSVSKIDKNAQADALLLTFKNESQSGLYISSDNLDLSAYYERGAIEFDLRVDDMDKGKLDVFLDCNNNCRYGIFMRDWALKQQGKGWQRVAIPMACLLPNASAGKSVDRVLTMRTGGKGQLAIANASISATFPTQQSTIIIECPSDITTKPQTLNEFWAVDWWLPRHKEKVNQANLGTAELVLIGDSITHGWEGSGKSIWQKYFAGIDTLNLGFSGDRTENVLWRLRQGELGNVTPKLIVIMIGTNNTGHRFDSPAKIRDGVAAILDELAQQVPESKVLVHAIFPRSATKDDPLRLNNEKTNGLLQQLVTERGHMFVDINAAFLEPDGTLTKEVMPDLLHPTETGYEIWAKNLKPYIEKHLR